MDETSNERRRDTDPLAEILRAAGRRQDPPQEHYDAVYEAARAAWRGKLRSRRKRSWFALAASLAGVGIGALIVAMLPTGDAGPVASIALTRGAVEQWIDTAAEWRGIAGSGLELEAGARIRTRSDGGVALALAAGGSLRLGPDTELALGIDSYRLQSGRVYFDSAGRRPEAAIALSTPFGLVRDIGTQFEATARTDALRVRVREGEVVVEESAAAEARRASVGDEIEVDGDGEWSSRTIAPDATDWSWVESLAVPPESGQSILVFLQWIARETGKQLRFAEPPIELSARFASFNGDPATLRPLDLLDSISATSDFNYQLTDDGAILIGRN